MDIRTHRLACLAACCAAVLPWPAWAQAAATPSVAASAAQMVLGLAIVIALILASLWLLKRASSRGGGAAGLLHVVAGIAVGPRERVVLVEVADTWLVLGVAPGQVRTLHQLPRIETPASGTNIPVPAGDFRSWLAKALEHKHATR